MTTVLVTGATGSLGPWVLGRLLRRADAVIALVRTHGNPPAQRRRALTRAVEEADPEAPLARLAVVPGDLARSDAGLASRDRRRLIAEVTHVLHLAADTRFSLPLSEARAGNLDTTLAMLKLAADLRRLEAMGFASTLYVAGTRSGEILESDLAETTFVNAYEQAKFEAERGLRARMEDLPIAVFRIATLLGSADTGVVPKPTAIHHMLRLYHRGLVPMVPGDPSQTLELLSLEDASEAVARLLLDAFAPGGTFHLTAGPGRTFTLADMVDDTHRLLRELDPEWARRGIEPPALVSPSAYALFERTVLEAGDPTMSGIVGSLATFLPQLLHPKRFDRANVEAALPDWNPFEVRRFYPLVLSYCLRYRWGRGGVDARSPQAVASP